MTHHPEPILGSLDEFETCPDWVPGMDRCQRFVPIILETLGVDWFDHSASWPAKVRNVSMPGSHFLGSQECYFPTSAFSC